MLYSVLTDPASARKILPQRHAHSIAHEHLAVIFEDDGETGYFYAMVTPPTTGGESFICI